MRLFNYQELDITGLHPIAQKEVYDEIVENRIYERFKQVKDGDVVMDIGANIGVFPYSLKYKNPKIVYCIEPAFSLIPLLKNNLRQVPYESVVINKGITSKTEVKNITQNQDHIYGEHQEWFSGISFPDLIDEFKIDHIDFLKIDCEGGEYQIFTEENYEYLTQKVHYITGEWHLSGLTDGVENFIKFKNLYLKGKNNFKVFEQYIWKDVTHEIIDDEFIYRFFNWWDKNKEAQLIVYIDNSQL